MDIEHNLRKIKSQDSQNPPGKSAQKAKLAPDTFRRLRKNSFRTRRAHPRTKNKVLQKARVAFVVLVVLFVKSRVCTLRRRCVLSEQAFRAISLGTRQHTVAALILESIQVQVRQLGYLL